MGRERAHLTRQLGGRAREVERPVVGRDLGGERDALLGLGRPAAGGRPRGRRGPPPAAARRVALAARSATRASSSSPIVTRCDASIGPVSSPASIRMIVTPVSVDAVHDRPLHRGGAAVGGEQREVDVDRGPARQDARRAGSGRRPPRRAPRAPVVRDRLDHLGVVDRRRAQDRDPELLGGRPRPASATAAASGRARLVGLGHDGGHLVAGADQRAQRRRRRPPGCPRRRPSSVD